MNKLDEAICNKFRAAVTAAPYLTSDSCVRSYYNLFCALMDRLDTAIRYLNNHWNHPDSEEDFICFLTFAYILNEGINKVYKKVFCKEPDCNMDIKHFSRYCMKTPFNFTEENCPSDEAFFEYFRSLTIAHPYETSRNKSFGSIFGIQVSPWVIVRNYINDEIEDGVGVRLYSSKQNEEGDIVDIIVSFGSIKDFLIEKYELLNEITNWVVEDSQKCFKLWKKDKVNRQLHPVDILKDICRILDSRHMDTYEIQTIIEYLEFPIMNENNKVKVNEYREYINSYIPQICDYVDELDDEKLFDCIFSLSYFRPTGMHEMAHYQLEKIFNYLQNRYIYLYENSNEEWALLQAKQFYDQFASKWVYMDIDNMDYLEIRLLVTVSLFMESKEQGKLRA